ncbi:DNA-binding transcriptional regulator, AcrR family [Sinosporangium album]|uniref:DNA-binding transcriptional regulator, AcrR family n=1 Tax=Sinosporangium album TaxID=504805 RepID=A0A1G7YVR6_9ACTN|nr:TetR/AcrR family transcriptional regulator [Sinosporangium album]SDH00319.1 DNA-binding transcriptional regulator, AcrR family [Sinosporangium album]
MATTNQNGGNRRPRGGRIRAGSSRRAQSEQTELHLLRTATWLFSERGFHGTGIRDIADAAGVAVSAMYYYASSKDELLEAVMRRTLDVLVSSGEETLRDVADPAERLAAVIASHVAFHARNPRAAKVADHEFHALTGQVRQDILQQRDAYETVWSSILSAGVHDGTFKDRGTVARLALLQMTTGVAHWYRPHGELKIPQLCERFAEMGLALMGASREGRALEACDVNLPDTQLLLRRAELTIEPREKPTGL